MTVTSESSPEPPLAVSSVLLRQEALGPGASPEPPLPASTVSLLEAPVAGASLEPPLLASSERQEVQVASASLEPVPAPPPPASSAKQQPRVSPAMPRSASRQEGRLGPRHGLVSILAAQEDIGMNIADQYPPHMPAPELPSSPSSELVTPDTYAQASMDVHAYLWWHSVGTV